MASRSDILRVIIGRHWKVKKERLRERERERGRKQDEEDEEGIQGQ